MASSALHMFLVYALVVPVVLLLLGTNSSHVFAARWFSPRPGTAIGMVTLGVALGGVIMPPFVAELIADHGWLSALRILGFAVAVIIMPLCLVVLRDGQKTDGSDRTGSVSRCTVRTIFRDRRFWTLMTAIVPLIAVFTTIQIHLGSYASERGFTLKEAAYLVSSFSASAMLGKFVAGFLTDRLDLRFLLFRAAVLVLVGLVSTATLPSQLPPQMLALAILAMPAGGAISLLGASLTRIYGSQTLGRAMGCASAPLSVNMLVAPAVAQLRDFVGGYPSTLMILSGLMVPTVLATIAMKRSHDPVTNLPPVIGRSDQGVDPVQFL